MLLASAAAVDPLLMTMVLLVVLGWSVVSLLAAGLWATVLAGARHGAARTAPAWEQPSRAVAAGLPAPRSSAIDAAAAV